MEFKIGCKRIQPGKTVETFDGARFTFLDVCKPAGSLIHRVMVSRPCEGEPDEVHAMSPFLFGGWLDPDGRD